MSRRIALLATMALALGASLLFAAPASAGGSCYEPLVSMAGTEVGMDSGCFSPNLIHALPGQTVTFTNLSGTAHTVTGLGGEWGSELADGDSAAIRFDETGVYPYFCHYHLGMIGAVVVGDVAAPSVEGAAADPQAIPEIVEETVEDAVETVEDAVPAAATTSGASGPAVAVGAAVLGLVAGLVLRGRLRSVP